MLFDSCFKGSMSNIEEGYEENGASRERKDGGVGDRTLLFHSTLMRRQFGSIYGLLC
ncbi:hypothetical protein J6590_017645 [Homalodisca vitripennis]|nr:hypothetical protein J6590_017645 [Homalodisca vitripennis]